MEDKLNDIEKRLKKIEDLHKWGIIIVAGIVSYYMIFKVIK